MQKQAQEKPEEKAPLVCSKEPYREPNQPLKIRQIEFGLQAPHEIMKCGVIHVYDRALYKMPERQPHPHGVLDRRMGISNKTAVCETCGQKLVDCSGHFGYIKLELPVFHIGYFKNTIQILQCICKYCSHLLLPEEERIVWLKRFRNPRTERVQKQMMFRKLVARSKLVRCCPCCGEWNGVVKKATGCLKIIHDRYKNKGILEEYKETFLEASNYNDQLGGSLNRLFDDMNPLRVLDLFERIPDEHCEVLDLVGRPETLLMTHIAVPPLCIRPSVEMDSTSNEDDITMKLTQIIEVNNILRSGLDKGLPINQLMENWDFLQVQAACLINSDLPGIPPTMQQPGRPLRGFVQRLKGKQGRFRGNLSGKRVDFSGRTVISPDPNLMIHQVGVPRHMAVVLTYPDRVTQHNLAKLRQRILNGVATHPGANFVISADGQVKTYLKYGDRRRVAADLKVGDVVERHLDDGDVILFNRQPSLHRISIMAFRAKVRTWRTLRFNECVCSPFNADFDGDEMNLHLPQTEEARAEAINLMGSVNNLCTPKNGDVMISATQDFLTSAFVVTSKDMFLTRSEMGLYLASMSDATDAIDLPPPAIIKPLEMWTGKQLFSMLIRPNAKVRLFVNLEMPEKIYSRKGLYMCPNDGYVLFQNSQLICGRLGKGILGGHKSGLFGVLNSDFSATAAAACMTRLSKMAARFLGNRGFSIGIDDVMPKEKLQTAKQKKVDEGYAQCDKYIQLYKKGALELQPGCNLEQTLEASVTGVLNNIREIAGKVCMDTLHWHNSPLIMSQCGSKGSPINIAQMVACVGQQSVSGKRCFNGFKDRTLPHFPRGDKTPAGKGFVANSFFSGLTATEFFFHTMGGREGLVDTAVKTAETGYMSRRLMKALEDLYVHYDLTVRNAAGGIVQLTYGDDGMDPVSMEGKDGKPLDFERLKLKICAMIGRDLTGADRFTEVQLPSEMQALMKKLVDRVELKDRGLEESQWCSPEFRNALKGFLQDQVKSLTAARERLNLKPGERGDAMLEYLAGMAAPTERQLRGLVQHCLEKYERKRIEPGSTVGAVGAQSIGEPGTQMTLKTFHFAGVASMNVTLGVPRIKEIINGARNISTPIMNVELSINSDIKVARIVKGRLEKTTLGQVARSIKLVMRPGATSSEAGIVVKIDMEAVDVLQLDVDAYSVRTAILAHPRIKLKPEHVGVLNYDKVMVKPADSSKGSLLFNLEQLLSTLPKVIVSGIPTVERAVVNAQKDGTYQLFIEGTNVQRVMATLGVDGTRTTTNHIDEIERYLGIEAARSQIAKEIQKTMGAHGMSIDDRHMMLLADCMTYKGEVLGITRFGIAKMKDSVLHSASFEKTSDHLFDAAIHGRKDDVVGVSESIIMGIPMPTGTGLFKLRHNVGSLKDLTHKPMPLLAY